MSNHRTKYMHDEKPHAMPERPAVPEVSLRDMIHAAASTADERFYHSVLAITGAAPPAIVPVTRAPHFIATTAQAAGRVGTKR